MINQHLVRYGSHNEQPYFKREMANCYGGIAFNANLVAWAPSGLAAFLCAQDLADKFSFIDPLTHAFQHDPSALTNDDGEVKPSIAKLVKAYGSPLTDLVGKGAVVPEDFSDEGILADFVKNVLFFQKDTLQEEARNTDAWPILEFRYGSDFRIAPSLLVAPYFYMTTNTAKLWGPLNRAFVEKALAEVGPTELGAQLVLGKEVLRGELGKKLMDEYARLASDGYVLLWVDDFSEHDVTSGELRGFVNSVQRLQAGGAKVVNLYGGFFSIALTGKEFGVLSSVCHGPQYGESRELTPVGGGLPVARFYMRSLHSRLRFADAFRILQRNGWLTSEASYFENVCNCTECRQLIKKYGVSEGFAQYGKSKPVTFERGGSTVTMSYPLRETQESATRHYLYAKEFEFRMVGESSGAEIVKRLRRAQEKFKRDLGLDAVAHLGRWADALEEIRRGG